MAKRGTGAKVVLYAVLTALAVLFLFPFYWVVSSSFKSREGMSLTPPSWYPAERRTARVALTTTNRLFVDEEGDPHLLLTRSPDLLAGEADDGSGESDSTNAGGAYLLALEGDAPTQRVRWVSEQALTAGFQPVTGSARRASGPAASDATTDTTPPPSLPLPDSIIFEAAPVHQLEDSGRLVAVLSRMVRQDGGSFSQVLLVTSPQAGNDATVEALANPKHREVRVFAPRLANYPETLKGPEATFGQESVGFLRYMANSLFISTLAVLGQLASSSMVAFAFARLRFRGRDGLFVVLLATLMVPGQVTLIPLFGIYKQLGWIDSFLPLIVPHFTAGAFNVFLLRQYMLTLPGELDDAAAIDGCGPWATYRHVILPNCVPALVLVGLFTFVYTWQDVMGPLIYLDDPALRTVTLGLEFFRSPYVDNRHLLMTGAVLVMLPVAALFLFFQRHIMSGIATTGIKG